VERSLIHGWQFGQNNLKFAPMLEPLTNVQIRKFKAAAQRMDANLKVGKAGLSDGFVRTVDAELGRHELVKIKFVEFKEEKKTLAPLLAEKTICRRLLNY
jgi:RNA-binding protein